MLCSEEDWVGLGKLGNCLERNRQGEGRKKAQMLGKLKMQYLAYYNNFLHIKKKINQFLLCKNWDGNWLNSPSAFSGSGSVPKPSFTKIWAAISVCLLQHCVLVFVALPSILMLIFVVVFRSSGITIKNAYTKPGVWHAFENTLIRWKWIHGILQL